MKKYILLLIFCVSFLFGQDPSDVKWKEINTPHYRIVYPEEIHNHANRIANRMEYIYPKIGFYMQNGHKPISLILSNRSVDANGYVTLAPRRSEWYSLPWPGQSLYVGDWHNLLSIHETRHIAQVEFSNRGITRWGKLLFGELGQFAGLYYIFPEWFIEGDAVMSETLLSESGRGRIANFQQAYRAMILSNKTYKYEKARFDSYKNHVPDHYEMGYFMSAYLGRQEGYETWHDVIDYSSRRWFWRPFSPINAGIKKYTDFSSSEKLYNGMVKDLDDFWQKDFEHNKYTKAAQIINDKDKYYTDYLYPHIKNENEILYLKSGLADQPTLCELKNGKSEELLLIPAFAKYYGMDISDNFVVWSQYSEDKRWTKESWSELMIHNMKTRRTKFITHKAKFINPAISKDENFIAAVEFNEKRECSLVILDRKSGEMIHKIPSPNNETINFPSWSDGGKNIVFTGTGFEGRAIYQWNFDEQKLTQLTDYWRENMFRPMYWQNFVLYESDYTGVDNIFALNPLNGELFQVTSRKYGATYPAIYQNQLVFSDYTVDGYKLMKMELDSTSFIPFDRVKKMEREYFKPLLTNQFQPIEEYDIPQKQYSSSEYKGVDKYFNYHSWMPLSIDEKLGLQAFSDNILQTVSHTEYFLYDLNQKNIDYGATLNWLKHYPKITIGINLQNRDKRYFYLGHYGPIGNVDETWKELHFSLLAELPLYRKDFGINTKLVNIEAGTGIKQVFDKQETADFDDTYWNYDNADETFVPIHLGFNMLTVNEKSYQAIVPNYGKISMVYNRMIGMTNKDGEQRIIDFSAGYNLCNNTGLIIDMQKEMNLDNGYSYVDYVSQFAVIDNIYSQDRYRIRGMLRQHLWYPDIDFFWFLYVKRFVLNLSLDMIFVDNYNYANQYVSKDGGMPVIGIGLTTIVGGIFDFHIHLPVTVTWYHNYLEDYSGVGFSF